MLPAELALLTERLEEGIDGALSTVCALAGIASTMTEAISQQASMESAHSAIEILAKELATVKYDAARVRVLADAHIDTLHFVFESTLSVVDDLRHESGILGDKFAGYYELTTKIAAIQASIAANFPGPEFPGRR